MPAGAASWALPGQAEQEAAWAAHLDALKRDAAKERFMQGCLRERLRAFAIETGQIEGHYTLRRGVTEQLARQVLAGRMERPNGNGGRTIGDEYCPPAGDGTAT